MRNCYPLFAFRARLRALLLSVLLLIVRTLSSAQSVRFTEYPLASSAAFPESIVAGPDGALWFPEYFGNKIGRITTAGAFSEYPVPTSSSGLDSITAGPDGALWFTEASGNKIGRITTAGAISEYLVPTPSSGAFVITTGPDGALWFYGAHCQSDWSDHGCGCDQRVRCANVQQQARGHRGRAGWRSVVY